MDLSNLLGGGYNGTEKKDYSFWTLVTDHLKILI